MNRRKWSWVLSCVFLIGCAGVQTDRSGDYTACRSACENNFTDCARNVPSDSQANEQEIAACRNRLGQCLESCRAYRTDRGSKSIDTNRYVPGVWPNFP